eukprot:364883-Alexandrium_andersonii.AAC.1
MTAPSPPRSGCHRRANCLKALWTWLSLQYGSTPRMVHGLASTGQGPAGAAGVVGVRAPPALCALPALRTLPAAARLAPALLPRAARGAISRGEGKLGPAELDWTASCREEHVFEHTHGQLTGATADGDVARTTLGLGGREA